MARPGEMHTDMWQEELNRQTQEKMGLSQKHLCPVCFLKCTHLLRRAELALAAPAVNETLQEAAVTVSETICAAVMGEVFTSNAELKAATEQGAWRTIPS